MGRWVCVINPRSAGGRTARAWPRLAAALEAAGLACQARFTEGPGDGARLTREALLSGAEVVVAVGGDGTIHEVANGFIEADQPIAPAARLGILPAGSGSDLIKSLGIPSDAAGAVATLTAGRTRRLDLGRLDFQEADGTPRTRYFINTASAGLSGAALVAMRPLPAWMAGTPGYLAGALQALLSFKAAPLELVIDGQAVHEPRALLVVIGNGAYFGSGMRVLPEARPDDGWLDVLVVRERPLHELLVAFPRLYTGAHMALPLVRHWRAREVAIAGDWPLEMDGEQPGSAPARIRLLPGTLTVLA